MDRDALKKSLIAIAIEAGKKIIEVYTDAEQSKVVDWKSDDSPLTLADQAANAIIVKQLALAFPEIPIISEEEAQVDYAVRAKYQQFFLVDPLDGTKEFINRNGEFTVNIALVNGNTVEAGVIYVPVTETIYYGDKIAKEAVKIESGESTLLSVVKNRAERIAVRSKSHASPEEAEVLAHYKVEQEISVGSSLKFCMVAEGKADVYYRHGPTMEWDTAAGQAIAEAAGAVMTQGADAKNAFVYNKESLLNGNFLLVGI